MYMYLLAFYLFSKLPTHYLFLLFYFFFDVRNYDHRGGKNMASRCCAGIHLLSKLFLSFYKT